MNKSNRLIATSAIVTFGVGYLGGVQRGAELPTARFLIGMGITFTVISVINDLGSPLGGALAVLIMVAALIHNGTDATKFLQKTTKRYEKTTTKKGKNRGQNR